MKKGEKESYREKCKKRVRIAARGKVYSRGDEGRKHVRNGE